MKLQPEILKQRMVQIESGTEAEWHRRRMPQTENNDGMIPTKGIV